MPTLQTELPTSEITGSEPTGGKTPKFDRVPIIASQVLWVAALLCLTASLIAMFLSHGWGKTPVIIRFVCGLVTFGLTPGFLIFCGLSWRNASDSGIVSAILKMLVLSFTCNLVLNVFLFVFQCSFAQVAVPYLFLLLTGLLSLGWVGFKGASGWAPLVKSTNVSLDWISGAIIAASLLICSAVVAIAYQTGSMAVSPEELIVLRKLVENPQVCFNNISSTPGEPSTYFFVPFQILVVGVSFLSKLDVAMVYSAFWCFTTGVSLAALINLAGEYSQNRLSFVAMGMLCALIAFFDANSVIYDIGIATPYPNRYGFAHGVLLPLNLGILCGVMKERFTKPVHVCLLIYLIIEMTFVHARETVLLLGCIIAIFALALTDFRNQKRVCISLGTVLLATCSILFAYKTLNAWAAQDLTRLLTMYHSQTHQALQNLVEKHGLVGALFTSGPDSIIYHLNRFGIEVPTEVTNYKQIFVDSWSPERWPCSSRIILPLCLLLLPLYAAKSRSKLELAFCYCLTGLALISMSGLLKLTIAYYVGSPEVLCYYNLVYILALCVMAHMVAKSSLWAAERLERKPVVWVIVVASLLVTLLLGAVLGQSVGLKLQKILNAIWTPLFAVSLHLCTAVTLIVCTIRNRGVPVVAEQFIRPVVLGKAAVISALGILILLSATLRHSSAWASSSYHFDNKPSKFVGNFEQDYQRLTKRGGLISYYPLPIVQFLRNQLPVHQTVLCGNAIALLEFTDHFAAIMTANGNIAPSYICNWKYIQEYQQRAGTFAFMDFLTRPDDTVLNNMLKGLAVDIVVVGPDESASVDEALAKNPNFCRLLNPVFRSDGYLVLQVQKTQLR